MGKGFIIFAASFRVSMVFLLQGILGLISLEVKSMSGTKVIIEGFGVFVPLGSQSDFWCPQQWTVANGSPCIQLFVSLIHETVPIHEHLKV